MRYDNLNLIYLPPVIFGLGIVAFQLGRHIFLQLMRELAFIHKIPYPFSEMDRIIYGRCRVSQIFFYPRNS